MDVSRDPGKDATALKDHQDALIPINWKQCSTKGVAGTCQYYMLGYSSPPYPAPELASCDGVSLGGRFEGFGNVEHFAICP